VSILMTVVLPLPLGPRNPKISPFSTRKLTSFTAVTLPKRRTKCCAEMEGFVEEVTIQLAAESLTSAAMPARTRWEESSMRTFTPKT